MVIDHVSIHWDPILQVGMDYPPSSISKFPLYGPDLIPIICGELELDFRDFRVANQGRKGPVILKNMPIW